MVTLRYSYVYHIFPTFEKQQTTQQSPQTASAHVPDGRSSRGSNRLLRISSLLRTSLTPKGDNFYVAVVAPRCWEKTHDTWKGHGRTAQVHAKINHVWLQNWSS